MLWGQCARALSISLIFAMFACTTAGDGFGGMGWRWKWGYWGFRHKNILFGELYNLNPPIAIIPFDPQLGPATLGLDKKKFIVKRNILWRYHFYGGGVFLQIIHKEFGSLNCLEYIVPTTQSSMFLSEINYIRERNPWGITFSISILLPLWRTNSHVLYFPKIFLDSIFNFLCCFWKNCKFNSIKMFAWKCGSKSISTKPSTNNIKWKLFCSNGRTFDLMCEMLFTILSTWQRSHYDTLQWSAGGQGAQRGQRRQGGRHSLCHTTDSSLSHIDSNFDPWATLHSICPSDLVAISSELWYIFRWNKNFRVSAFAIEFFS